MTLRREAIDNLPRFGVNPVIRDKALPGLKPLPEQKPELTSPPLGLTDLPLTNGEHEEPRLTHIRRRDRYF